MAFDRDAFLRRVQEKAINAYFARAQHIASETVCATHNQSPTVELDGERLAITGCCAEVRQSVLSQLKSKSQ